MAPKSGSRAGAALLGLALLGVAAERAAAQAPASADAPPLERYRQARTAGERLKVLDSAAGLRGPVALALFGEVLEHDPDESLRLAAVERLAALGSQEAEQRLVAAIDRWDPFVSAAVVDVLKRRPTAQLADWILGRGLERAREPELKAALIEIVGALAAPADPEPGEAGEAGDDRASAARAACRSRLGSDHPEVRAAALNAYCALAGPKDAARALQRALRDRALRVRLAAVACLARQDEAQARERLAKAAERDDAWQVQLRALEALTAQELRRELLTDLLEDRGRDWRVRLAALAGLEPLRDQALIKVLVAERRRATGLVAADLQTSLQRLTGQPWSTGKEWARWWSAAEDGYELPLPSVPNPDATRTRARFYGISVVSDRPCFVIDASESMLEPSQGTAGGSERSKFDVALRELRQALEGLPKRARFGVLLFDHELIPIQQEPVAATPRNVARALSLVEAFRPQGATDLYTPLATVLHGSRPGDAEAADKVRFDSVYLLSDGLPTAGPVTETAELSRRIALFNALARVRFHCVGIGEHDQALLRRLAQDSRGSYVVR